ncbi:unnamed protein product (macronuclear) [Paramecium tetraurelia]|uniref:Transmembrane protein n=1 Tax=Paramecium tetraurelia TaxID=5888 RepID=A0D9G6_PARTE|nr:uncharacterized protein GSPATT00014613001 [Paramecium tetraurelia]CAK79683.1 unnamed protein product [Paramecium tetraurelia]|eukprot:XP_001447080.1 hypothetical protein (macronuclear) [Paramecium tetraurelia strain d4-2]
MFQEMIYINLICFILLNIRYYILVNWTDNCATQIKAQEITSTIIAIIRNFLFILTFRFYTLKIEFKRNDTIRQTLIEINQIIKLIVKILFNQKSKSILILLKYKQQLYLADGTQFVYLIDKYKQSIRDYKENVQLWTNSQFWH